MTRQEFNSYTGPYAFILRDAQAADEIDWSTVIQKSGMWCVRLLADDRERQYTAWFRESLATALLHPNPVVATRATFQAIQYAGWLKNQGLGGPTYYDALAAAQNRVVDQLKG